MLRYVKKYANQDYLYKILCDPNYLSFTCWTLLAFEVVLNTAIIEKVRYTEIDWIAYMQEVDGFINGTLDYKELRGDTGPLVYPAGFVYVYSLLYYVTSHGANIRLAQYIFLVLYIAQQFLVFRIHKKAAKVPPYAIILSTITSYRIHSIFVLRLFNDPIAVLLFYTSLNLFLSNRWILGSFVYSLAVSIKMNILLYAPCLLIAYLTNLTVTQTILNLFICGVVQLVLGFPFLYVNFWSYLKGSFDLGRVFEHKWTVNYRFLDREIFENRYFHFGLILLHIALLGVFFSLLKRYLGSYAKLNAVVKDLKVQSNKIQTEAAVNTSAQVRKRPKKLGLPKQVKEANGVNDDEQCKYDINFNRTSQLFVLPFFVTNLIGIACARSLHYQFYTWYFHSLLYLVYCTDYSKPFMFLILGVLELCWNTYPSTDISSVLIHGCHIFLLCGVYKYMKK